MGGLGSGRHFYYSAKAIVDNYHAIDIRKWCRKGFLTPGTVFTTKWLCNDEVTSSIRILAIENGVTLTYQHKHLDEWKNINYSIDITWTPCKLGGNRPWFICPTHNCGRRVAILYGGTMFACRRCYQLAYPSQRENLDDRATRRAEKIRERLCWEPGILNGEGLKPKGMHWKTFKRLCYLHNIFVNISISEATLRFGINMFDLY